MELYLKVSFWMTLVGIIFRALFMMFSDYPRKTETKLGADIVLIMISISFLCWIIYLRNQF